MDEKKIYICIDLKSFYASVECIARGLDPATTNLVVADPSRTDKTICLAVSPAMKALGVPGRCRVFEIPKDIDYIMAVPRMRTYMEISTQIYGIYLRYISEEDIHVYSIDEVFMDVTHYLKLYRMTARELATEMVRAVFEETGITATAGIGTNMYLAKVAMDIVAKHMPADANGARIATLTERTYREYLWDHRPLTDFWRVGRGYAKKLEANGLYTMGDIARCSLGKPGEFHNEDLLYKLFGVNAELLIDHAWGWEPCTIAQVKAYRPENTSVGSGQVLQCPYTFEKARLITREMTELLVLDLVKKRLMTDQMVLTVGYDRTNLEAGAGGISYRGEVKQDYYGRMVPKHAHGTKNLPQYTSSTRQIVEAVLELYDEIVNPLLSVRRVNITACRVLDEKTALQKQEYVQMDLFTDMQALEQQREQDAAEQKKEKKLQQAMLDIQERYGRNAILKGFNLEEGAMTMERNQQIGGHKA